STFSYLFKLLCLLALFLKSLTAKPGQDVPLHCQVPKDADIAFIVPDLEPKYVLYCSDGHLDPTYQHPSFKDRVDLVDREMKDGDVSLILKNVSRHDAGTYECRVKPDSSRRKKRAFIDSEPIRIIFLQVTEPGEVVSLSELLHYHTFTDSYVVFLSSDPNSGNSMNENSMNDVPEDGNSSPGGRYLGLAAGVLVGLLLVAAAVVGVLMYKRHKDKRSGQPKPYVKLFSKVHSHNIIVGIIYVLLKCRLHFGHGNTHIQGVSFYRDDTPSSLRFSQNLRSELTEKKTNKTSKKVTMSKKVFKK
uniref:Ig-like domain-containing protein n=1 Tax=Sander lucioperca TaxID=283035 RepID=A0A8D0A7Y2_SANLU